MHFFILIVTPDMQTGNKQRERERERVIKSKNAPKLNLNQGLVRVWTTGKPTRAEPLQLHITPYGLTATRSVSVKESSHIDAEEHFDVE